MQKLNRNEMKKIMGGFICQCNYGDCDALLTQSATSWTLTLECGNEVHNYDGIGEYGGTVCGGQCPDWITGESN